MSIPLSISYLITFVLYEALNVFSNIWLSNLVDDQNIINDVKTMLLDNLSMNAISETLSSNHSLSLSEVASIQNAYTTLANNLTTTRVDLDNRRDYYLWWYFGFGWLQAILVAVFSILYSFMVANASRYIHSRMLGKSPS